MAARSSRKTSRSTRAWDWSDPIVMMSTNPLGLRFVASFDRGDITGVSLLGPGIAGKRIELLKELIPDVYTPAALWKITLLSPSPNAPQP